METINYGIDLGTTNSLIAMCQSGKIVVFKNPIGFKETLPSCVSFRNDRVIIGDKARDYITKDPKHVFSAFKRKMGTSESYLLPSNMEFYSPVTLSALILKELKNFIPTDKKPESIVITIPASFDTVQCNATKQAGLEAGFQEIVLLQEPVAASLAFFNYQQHNTSNLGKWLVYDLGGGTFDLALITIDDDEMRVKDHEGDNFLGGVDIDRLIVKNFIFPYINQTLNINDIESDEIFTKEDFEKLYFILLIKAEEAKKELSNVDVTDIEFEIEYQNSLYELSLELKRLDLESILSPIVNNTIDMVYQVLGRNMLSNTDINKIILIGGSTLIPYIRTQLYEKLKIEIDFSADPTTAVAVGAAYYAASKIKNISTENQDNIENLNTDTSVQVAYNKTSKDDEEYISFKINKIESDWLYRITRNDGGYDSGNKKIENNFGEFVFLKKDCINIFNFKIFNAQGNEIKIQYPNIEITQGLYSLYGQTLPEDICIEIDDTINNTTVSEKIFSKNAILPLKKTIYKEIARTIPKNSNDSLIINILEGHDGIHPSANKTIGIIEINSKMLVSDLVQGTEVEISINISESREISVEAYLTFTNQRFKEIFNPQNRNINIEKLKEEIVVMNNDIQKTIDKSIDNEQFEIASELQHIKDDNTNLLNELSRIKHQEIGETKYQLDERKRKNAKQFYSLGLIESPVFEMKRKVIYLINFYEYYLNTLSDLNENFKKEFEMFVQKFKDFVKSTNFYELKSHYRTLNLFYEKLLLNSNTVLISHFYDLKSYDENEYKNYNLVKNLITKGEKALENEKYHELRNICNQIWNNKIHNNNEGQEPIKGTGLSS